MYISVHPEPTGKREPSARSRDPKRRKGEKEPRARLFNPAMQKWFALAGDLLPHPERMELLTHPQAVRCSGAAMGAVGAVSYSCSCRKSAGCGVLQQRQQQHG